MRAPVMVVVPCYNGEAGLAALFARLDVLLRDGGRGWRVLFVDDGSADATFACLLSEVGRRPWARVVRHTLSLGLGAALRTGLRYAESPIVCTVDSDCTYAPERLPELVALLADGAEIATAWAWHPGDERADADQDPDALGRAVSALYQRLVGQDVHAFTCLFRAYRRDALVRIPLATDGSASGAEIMLRALLAGYRVRELPMRLGAR